MASRDCAYALKRGDVDDGYIKSKLSVTLQVLDEVKSVFEFRHLQSLNTVGYKELFRYLNSEIEFDEAVQLIKKNTRNYAKRQLTWFRKDNSSIWLKYSDTERQLNEVISSIK